MYFLSKEVRILQLCVGTTRQFMFCLVVNPFYGRPDTIAPTTIVPSILLSNTPGSLSHNSPPTTPIVSGSDTSSTPLVSDNYTSSEHFSSSPNIVPASNHHSVSSVRSASLVMHDSPLKRSSKAKHPSIWLKDYVQP